MTDWIEAGMPVCNKWVWDEDGWFYWPEPVLPQTATGLLLDKIVEKMPVSGKSYYAINLVGQFVDADQDSWGKPEVKEGDTVKVEASGFYIDGFTDNARALLEQAASVQIGEDTKWYLPFGSNIFKEITDDEGTLGDPICGGLDEMPGNEDDRTDVVYVKDGLKIGTAPNVKDYKNWFLKPRTTPYEPYYRAVGKDGLLGTADDDRLWLISGTFPTGEIVDKIADSVEIAPPTGLEPIAEKTVEVEVGKTIDKFGATVKLGTDTLTGDRAAVVWSVAAADGSELKAGTKITDGKLTVDENETPQDLIVTVRSKLDDRVKDTYNVKVYGKLNVRVTLEDGTEVTSIQAGKSVKLKAWLYRGDEEALEQPTSFTWNTPTLEARALAHDAHTITPDAEDATLATLTVGLGTAGQTVTVTVSCMDASGSVKIPITEPVIIITEQNNHDTVDIGGTLSYSFTFTHTSELEGETAAWEVGTSEDDGVTIAPVDGITCTDGVVEVAGDGTFNFVADTTYYVKVTTKDSTYASVSDYVTFTVTPPASITVTPPADGVEFDELIAMEWEVKNASNGRYTSQGVTWAATNVDGEVVETITIDPTTGKLKVSDSLVNGTVVKVTATSTVDSSVSKTIEITMNDNTVMIDSVKFYVLKEDTSNHKALILTKNCISKEPFSEGSSMYWPMDAHASVRTSMNTWLNSHSTLEGASLPTETWVRKSFQADSSTSSFEKPSGEVKIFLLSEADLFGTFNDGAAVAKDYTEGVTERLEDPSGRGWKAKYNGTEAVWWLRSPRYSWSFIAVVNPLGVLGQGTNNGNVAVRPALWVDTNKIPNWPAS